MKHVIYGPPGTGKSTYIQDKVRELILDKWYDPKRIGLCSYTKAAAKVLSSKCSVSSNWVGTIHSLAFKLIGANSTQVVNRNALKEFSEDTGFEFTGCSPDNTSGELKEADRYLALYHLHHAKMGDDYSLSYSGDDMPGTFEGFIYFVENYAAWKDRFGYIDYTDMLKMALDASSPNVDVMFVDEAQDLSPLQWAIIDKWAHDIPEMYIAGDDDQAIYEWAGACPRGMQTFEQSYSADRKVLGKSFRLPPEIHEKAMQLIHGISDRVDKRFDCRDGEGEIRNYGHISDILDISNGDDVLILYRNHSFRIPLKVERDFIRSR